MQVVRAAFEPVIATGRLGRGTTVKATAQMDQGLAEASVCIPHRFATPIAAAFATFSKAAMCTGEIADQTQEKKKEKRPNAYYKKKLLVPRLEPGCSQPCSSNQKRVVDMVPGSKTKEKGTSLHTDNHKHIHLRRWGKTDDMEACCRLDPRHGAASQRARSSINLVVALFYFVPWLLRKLLSHPSYEVYCTAERKKRSAVPGDIASSLAAMCELEPPRLSSTTAWSFGIVLQLHLPLFVKRPPQLIA